MPKNIKPLSELQVKHLKTVGWHAVGGVSGLGLQIRTSNSKFSTLSRSWLLRYSIGSQRKSIGLGSYPTISLSDARELARKCVLEIKSGLDPAEQKKILKSKLIEESSKRKTFKECANSYYENQSTKFSNAKHSKEWIGTLERIAYPYIGSLLVSDITMQNILEVMNQPTKDSQGKIEGKLWWTRTETASRVLGRIKTVLDFAIANGYRTSSNPAIWKGLIDTQLPPPQKITKVIHQPALPYSQIGEFVATLRTKKTISAKALEFLILTAVRSGSVRCAEWSEIDFESSVWIIPAEHTKTKQEHRVPLCPQSIRLLSSLPKIDGCNLIFPSPTNRPLSDNTISKLMRDMKENSEFEGSAVPHGFRSTFRDWAAEQTGFADDIRKAASGHTLGDAVLQAYQRTDLLEKRRQLMNKWGEFIYQPFIKKSNVLPIRKKMSKKKVGQTNPTDVDWDLYNQLNDFSPDTYAGIAGILPAIKVKHNEKVKKSAQGTKAAQKKHKSMNESKEEARLFYLKNKSEYSGNGGRKKASYDLENLYPLLSQKTFYNLIGDWNLKDNSPATK